MRHFSCMAAAVALSVGALSGPAVAADCPIKLGGLAPLSAPGTVVGGEAMRDAMLIAQDDINAAGGVLGCDVKVVTGTTPSPATSRSTSSASRP